MPDPLSLLPPRAGRAAPNVVFIIADDHRHDALGIAGHPAVRTPQLDALAARGTRFTQAYHMGGLSPAVCAPARAAILTGCNVIAADSARVASDSPERIVSLPPERPTLPALFRAAGYETFITGKWHNDVAALQRSFSHGRRIFLGGMSEHTRVPLRDLSPAGNCSAAPYFEAGFSTELFCDAALEFLAGARRPFFLYLALTSPHDPRTPPGEFARRYDPARTELPQNFLPEHPFDNGELAVRDEQLAPKPLRPDVLRAHLAAYHGMISHHDAQLGRVFAGLRAAGLEKDTVIVYVSDHGLALGSHGLLGKQNLYEPSVRVPLILAGPGVEPGRTDARLAYSLDLYATLAGLAGLTAPGGLDSVPLVGSADATRKSVFALYRDCQRTVRDDRWKLIRYRVRGEERIQLFDLERDPHELNDLAPNRTHGATVERLLRLLGRWQKDVGDEWMPVADAEFRATAVK